MPFAFYKPDEQKMSNNNEHDVKNNFIEAAHIS